MDRLELMRVFTVVARRGSFSAAADELDIAVQTVSKYIKSLEDHLDAQLFDRTTRKVSLNSTGRAYLEKCLDILEQVEEVELSVKREQSLPKGRIRMSAPTAFGELHLVPTLAKFQASYPDVSIELDLSNRRVALVEEGFDLALRIGQLSDSSMIARKLSSMRLSVVASPAYLEKFGRPSTPYDLETHNCLVDPNIRFGRNWPFLIEGKEVRVPVSGSFSANSPASVKKMVLAGLGIGICPSYILSEARIAGEVEVLLEENEAVEFGVYAIYPHRKHLTHRVRALVDFMTTEFRKLN